MISRITQIIICAKGGGGGGSGEVDYPDYMKTIHGDWLDNSGSDVITTSLTDVMNSALGSSPWTGAVAYNPASPIADIEGALTDFDSFVASLDIPTKFNDFMTRADVDITIDDAVAVGDATLSDAVADSFAFDLGDADGSGLPISVSSESAPTISVSNMTAIGAIANEIASVSDINHADISDVSYSSISPADLDDFVDSVAAEIDDNIDANVLPRFEAGMRDINAVVSSAFPIGRAIIEAFRDRDVAKASYDQIVGAKSRVLLQNAQSALQAAQINQQKTLAVEKANQEKNLAVERINSELDLRAETANAENEYRMKKANQDKDLMTARVNAENEVRVDLANQQTELAESQANQQTEKEVLLTNLQKTLQNHTHNQDMYTRTLLTNLEKNIKLAQINANKNVKMSLAKLEKDIKQDQLRLDAVRMMEQIYGQQLSMHGQFMNTLTEAKRIKLVALKEEADKNMEIDERDALWDLEAFQHGANMLASIGGGTVGVKKPSDSSLSSALGGAMSGAATGAMIGGSMEGTIMGLSGGPAGAIAGGLLGVASALL